MVYSNTNNIARVSNSKLTSGDDKLQPLVSLKTANAIDRFPATSNAINKLSGMSNYPLCPDDDLESGVLTWDTVTIIDAILLALEADRTGKEDEKRDRLRTQIGLKTNPA